MTAGVWLYKAPTDSVSPSELRYSIRAASRHLGIDEVWLVGDRPEWAVGVEHFFGWGDTGSKFRNLYEDLFVACSSRYFPSEFVLMNDDFHALRPYSPGVEHGGPLADRVAALTELRQFGDALMSTLAWLRRLGIPEPLTYELHRPLLMQKADAYRSLLAARRNPTPLHARTIYGALCEIGGEQVEDRKLIGVRQPDDWRQLDLVSTSESAWQLGSIGGWLRAQSPEPSPFER